MLKGQMMDRPLLVSSLIDYAAEVHSTSQIVTATVEGPIHRQTYAETRTRVARLANALLSIPLTFYRKWAQNESTESGPEKAAGAGWRVGCTGGGVSAADPSPTDHTSHHPTEQVWN